MRTRARFHFRYKCHAIVARYFVERILDFIPGFWYEHRQKLEEVACVSAPVFGVDRGCVNRLYIYRTYGKSTAITIQSIMIETQ